MIRVFPRRTKWTPTDDLAFVGDPPLFRPPEQPVRISVTFTWDIAEGERLYRAWGGYYSDVVLGGPAFGAPGFDFTPGLFLKEGVTITSRGCPRNCSWCFVPKREGKIREIEIKPGWIIQDNNLLACSVDHIQGVFWMLKRQKQATIFSGGLDARLLTSWHIDLFQTIKIKELWFACDSESSLNHLKKASDLLSDFPVNKKRCYVMIGYEDTVQSAERRLRAVYNMGFLPFAQLYQSEIKRPRTQEWDRLQRKWCRPAAYRTKDAINE